MLKLVQTLLGRKDDEGGRGPRELAPDRIEVDGADPFPLAQHLRVHEGLPIPDWGSVEAWIDGIADPARKTAAWNACARAWLLRLGGVLGEGYRIAESDGAIILSSLSKVEANAMLDYIERTQKRVSRVLDGIARAPARGKPLLLAFDDEETYYRYVSFYYPEGGEFAFSGGMHLREGLSHFVTVKSDLRMIEPVVAHEMTHAGVAHLPLPLWLNEGLAVNTEQRLVPPRERPRYTPQEMHAKHLQYWNPATIQEFWSGDSFYRPDDGTMLSYDLARIMVEQMATEWEAFRQFVLAANGDDGGARAARAHLGVDLGEYVCALLEQSSCTGWSPNPPEGETT